jgi:hypothetical protein
MTTTKMIYAIAAIVPGGLIALACAGILHVVTVGLRERRLRRSMKPIAPVHFGC